jgi:hypothetical protein
MRRTGNFPGWTWERSEGADRRRIASPRADQDPEVSRIQDQDGRARGAPYRGP